VTVPEPDPLGHPHGVPRTPPPDRLVVGRVVRPHGVRGELSVEVLSDAPDRFAPGAELGVGDPDGPEPLEPAVIRAARLHLGRLLLSLEGVEDRDAADRFRGAWLSIPVASARPLDPGEFWPHQLVGLTVVDHQGRERGRVADVVPGAAHDLLAVELPSGTSALVPAVAALVTVELEAGRVLVDAVPGLLDEA
jgi:16S rRNA processing protein RimM